MKEALKLALKALEKIATASHEEKFSALDMKSEAKQAITAIKAALAQPAHVISEQEQLKQWIEMTKYYRAKREYEPDAAQPAQEPVAKYIGECFDGSLVHLYEDVKKGTDFYTTPQQRHWVGLTDENMETLILKHAPPLHSDYEDDSLHGLLQAANDFLKELNT